MNSARNNPAAHILKTPSAYVSRYGSYDKAIAGTPREVRIFFVGSECWTTRSDETADCLRAAGYKEAARVIHAAPAHGRPLTHWDA